MKKRHIGIITGVTLFCVLATVMLAIWRTSLPAPETGSKTITVEVIHGDGTQVDFTYQTELEYLGELLSEQGLISGSEGPYGLFVDTVDGETVNYDLNKSWWKLSCDGEDAQTGADAVVIQNGSVYTWTYTIS